MRTDKLTEKAKLKLAFRYFTNT